MTRPLRHRRSYGSHQLSTSAEAMLEPMRAFLSWLLRIESDGCGKVVIHNGRTSARRYDIVLRGLLSHMRHDG